MRTTSSTLPVSPTPALSDETTLAAAVRCLAEHLPLKTQGACQPQTLYQVLLWAASRHDSIEHTAQLLSGVPTGNGLRYHLDKLTNMAALEQQMNAALQSRLPDSIANHRHRLALDLHLLPYYGVANASEAPYIYRSQSRAGTTQFFAYATVYVIRHQQRLTLAIHAIPQGETLVATITYLLDKLSLIRVKVEQLYLDRGFFSVPVIRWLQALRLPFLMPAVIRGKTNGTRSLCQGRKSYATNFTLTSNRHGTVCCRMVVICRYWKGDRRQHGIQYRLYVAYELKLALHQVHHHYRQRFGIESSYRIKNHCRIRTTIKNPVVRLLFVALAFVLVNLWIGLLWFFVSTTRRGGRRVHRERFRLKTMLEFLAHAVERQFPPIRAVFLPIPA